MKELSNTTIKLNGDYISESKVIDEKDNHIYYVVVSFGNLLYATFEGSYIDYKMGLSQAPNKVEGEECLWFDLDVDRGETKFLSLYKANFDRASHLQHETSMKYKYAHIKAPNNNIKYEVVDKQRRCVFSCGPLGDIYELKIHLTDSGKHLFVFADDYAYVISETSCFEAIDNDETVDFIEEYDSFSKTKKSKYYDLFLEMEKYIDGYTD